MKRIHLIPTTLLNRLVIGLLILLILIIAVNMVSLYSINSMNDAIREIIRISSSDVSHIVELRTLLFDISILTDRYLLYGNTEEHEPFLRLARRVETVFDIVQASSIAEEQKYQIITSRLVWRRIYDNAEAILKIPDPQSITTQIQEKKLFDENVSALFNLLGSLHEQIIQKTVQHQQEAQNAADRALFFIYVSFGLGVGIVIVVIILAFRAVIIPIRLLKQGVDKFGSGDLSHRVPVVSTDELGELARAFNTMAETLEKDQEELEQLAVNDGLTGLYNHREFQRRLQVEIERARRYKHNLSLLMIDIDHFKRFNDTYGHQAGDVVLRLLALQMRSGVRTVDSVARYGGEEFVIILPEMTASMALTVAERLRKNIAANAIAINKGHKVNVTVSIGVATFPEDADSKDELIAAADRALYAAKAAGRNKVIRAV